MSAFFRSQLVSAAEDASDFITIKKSFPVPHRPPGQSDADFFSQIHIALNELAQEDETAKEILLELTSNSDKWMALRTSMTGAERIADNDIYDQFVIDCPFPDLIKQLRRHIRSLRDQRQKLKAALPNIPAAPPPSLTPAIPSHLHLPKMTLPTFSGNCVEYESFWNSFKAGVHDLPSIPDAIKFTYLKECLKDSALTLINYLPICDSSYDTALRLLKSSYQNPEETIRSLHQNLRHLPMVRKEHICEDLPKLIDQFESLCVQFKQQSESYDTLHVQLEIEQKLPYSVLDEVLKAKEVEPSWNVDLLKKKLRIILKRREDLKHLSTRPSSSQRTNNPPNVNNSPQKQSSSQYNHSNQQQPPQSSLTFNAQQQQSFARRTPVAKLPCLFCEQSNHFSSHCQLYPDNKARAERVKQLKRCFKCLRDTHFSSACPKPSTCKSCNGAHPTALCRKSTPNSTGQSNVPNQNNPSQRPRGQYYAQNQPNNYSIPPSPAPSNNSIAIPHYFSPTPTPFSNPAPTTPLPTFATQFYPHHISNVATNPSTPMPPKSDKTASPSRQGNTVHSGQNQQILLKCLKVTFFNPDNPKLSRSGLALFDDGSTHSYINHSEANAIGLTLIPELLQIGTFNSPSLKPVLSHSTKFGLKLADGRSMLITANTLENLTRPTHYVPFSTEIYSLSELNYEMADPVILIGTDFYMDLEVNTVCSLPSGYKVVSTLLGPLIWGKSKSNSLIPSSSIHNINFSAQIPPSDFFSLESIGVSECTQIPDDQVHENFLKEIETDDSGRYVVKFPWKADQSSLQIPSNFGLCWGRLQSTIKTLQKDPILMSNYHKIIDEQAQLGIIETVSSSTTQFPPLHYLAHHPVFKPPPSKKVRIVYDGSAHINTQPSLNDCLYPGPLILADLIGLLLRFRIPKYSIISDIEKAFLQVSLHTSQRDCVRFLWLKDPLASLSNSNLQIFRFTRVPFGLGPSPYLLAATIQYHLSKSNSLFAQELKPNIYVDNIFFGTDSIESGKSKCQQIITLFQSAKMELREFISNSPQIIASLPADRILSDPIQKFLGIGWHTANDCLFIKISPPNFTPSSKRQFLSFIASHFDPLGFITPILLPLKIFLQTMWQYKLNWDDQLPNEAIESWKGLFKEWPQDFVINIPRRPSQFPSMGRSYQLHSFCDASSIAMCTTIYLRTSHPSSSISHSALIFSKTKVKPLSQKTKLTIPRLELIAVKMGTHALSFILSHYPLLPIDPNLYLWTDSSAVIGWLNAKTPNKEIFVANCLKSIRSTPNLIINHIIGLENPADLGTRGISSGPTLLSQKIWWNGPSWLEHSNWPKSKGIPQFSSNEYQPGISSFPPILTFTSTQTPIQRIIDPSNYSRLPHLLRIATNLLRFISKLCPKYNNISPFNFLLKIEQSICPPNDDDIQNLGLFIDESGLFRSKGRISNSHLPQSTIHPIFLPNKSPLTKLLIIETHLINLHSSPLQTLAIIRRKFWLPCGRRTIQHILYKECMPCRRFSSRPFDLPEFPQLPQDRVRPSTPFSSIGFDFCGPIYISPPGKTGKTKSKMYILLFVCLFTRAVSLDIVPDLSTVSFSLAFRRFMARFGHPTSIYSDNAPCYTNFQKEFPQFPNWTFRPPYAAWKGGHYERFVALIKFHLRRTLSSGLIPKIFTFDPIYTILTEIESIINSRPISFDSSIPSEPRPLRPIDFIRPLNQTNLPFSLQSINPKQKKPSSDPISLQNLWLTLQTATKSFISKWQTDYLLSLRERYKKLTPSKNRIPKIGELVLAENSSPRSLWPIAIIQKIFFNTNNVPDIAQIKLLSGHITTRSIRHLYPLETKEELQYKSSPIPTLQPKVNISKPFISPPPSPFPSHSNENLTEIVDLDNFNNFPKLDQPQSSNNFAPSSSINANLPSTSHDIEDGNFIKLRFDSIVSIQVSESVQLVDIYDAGNSKEIHELNMKMMQKTRFLKTNYNDPAILHTNKFDLYCRWLYQPARADGKPRVLSLGRMDEDYSPIHIFIDRIKQDFLRATEPVTFFIRIDLPKAFQPLEDICLDNGKTKERLQSKMVEADLEEWDEFVLQISRYPLAFTNTLIVGKEIYQKIIYLSEDLRIVPI